MQALQCPVLVHHGVADGTAVGHMHPHAKSFGAMGQRLGNVSETEQTQGLRAQFSAQRSRMSSPIGPALLPQILICLRQRHMPHEQGSHHIFGNRVFVSKTVGQCALRWQEGRVDGIGARSRCMEQPRDQGAWHALVQPDANDHIGALIMRALSRLVQGIAQVHDLVTRGDQLFKTWSEIGSIVTVENNFQGCCVHVEQRMFSA